MGRWVPLHLAQYSAVWFCLAGLTEKGPQTDCRSIVRGQSCQHDSALPPAQATELPAWFPARAFPCEVSTRWGHWYPGREGPHFRHMLFWNMVFLKPSSPFLRLLGPKHPKGALV